MRTGQDSVPSTLVVRATHPTPSTTQHLTHPGGPEDSQRQHQPQMGTLGGLGDFRVSPEHSGQLSDSTHSPQATGRWTAGPGI